jgi:uncharacterized protein (TIGR00266 family)
MSIVINQSDFEFNIVGAPDYAYLEVKIPSNKTLKVEASAMATMDTNIEMKSKFKGGLSRFLGGESLFVNEFTAKNGTGTLGIAPAAPGDLRHYYLDGQETVYLQSSGFVAAGMDVTVDSKWQGLGKAFFSGEGLFLLKCTGKGDLFFNSYGGIIPIEVTDDFVVDTGNIVGFTGGLEYNIQSIGSMKSMFLSGEGLVAKFHGQGTVWIQTKKIRPLIYWANPFRPQKG